MIIDLHQLNVKTTSDNTNQYECEATSCQRRTEPAEQQPATSAGNDWTELTSLLSKKGQEFLSLGHWSLPSETNVEKEHIHQLSDEESRVLPSEQDDVVNSLDTGAHCSNWVAVSPLSWQWQTACWAILELMIEWLAVMVISQPPRNNPSYYYRASPTLPQLLWMLPETPYILHACNYNIRVTHRNGAVIFFTNQIHGGIISRLFFIHLFTLHALALHLAVKILLQIFLYEDLSTLYPCICRLYFPPECQQDRTLLRNQYRSENIPNIWHKSTKHKEVRPDWNDKNDNTNYAPSYHGRFYQWLRLPFFKRNIRSSAKRFRLWIVLFWTKTSQRLTLYLLSSHR